MGRHTQSRSRRRLVLMSGAGVLIVVLGGLGVDAVVRSQDGAPSGSPRPSSPGAMEQPDPANPGSTPTRARPGKTESFPGRPEKKVGVRQSGLGSGLGDEADDLAARAQDLIDSAQRAPARAPLVFRLSSYNILGAAHTSARGNKPGYASGERRMGTQLAMLRDQNVDVVGFSEFEPPQFRSFMRRTGGAWGVYPALSKGRGGLRQSIAWRRDVWQLADYGTIPVPYFRGNRIPMPVILLTHKQTKRQLYLINVHNPASSAKRGNNERWRDEATRRQLAKVRSLRQAAPEVPVILMGDFNERMEVYCRVTGGGLMVAANPGGDGGGCSPPALMGIDWIFGTTDLSFSDYRKLKAGVSDHPMLVATARAD